MQNNYAIIMAGGVGSRFWPWSRTDTPKQFLDILDTGKTLIEQTFDRISRICPDENIIIVTNEIYKQQILDFLPKMKEENVLLEPRRRNTAPCIAYAAHKINKTNPDARIIVAPADHIILKEDLFVEVSKAALDFSAEHDVLITMGIEPHRPETGYGYIKIIKNEKMLENEQYEMYKVDKFTEKPDLETARKFYESGQYFWNSGMFVWSLQSILTAFEKLLPDVNQLFADHSDALNTEKETEAIDKIYEKSREISIDYGVMEQADNVNVICTDIGWSDIGTWGALYEHAKLDESKNARQAKRCLLYDSENCVIKIPDEKVAVVQGLKDYIVVDEGDTILICRKQDEQKIKQYRKDVKEKFGDKFV